MSRRHWLFSSTFLSGVSGVFLTTLSVQVASAGSPLSDMFDSAAYRNGGPALPAVDGINGKIAPFGGSASHDPIYGVEGSIQFPLDFKHGLQIDGRVGNVDGHTYGEIGGHLFWRDPSIGLFGFYAHHAHLSQFGGADVTNLAVEGERYWGRWTVQGIAGIEFGNTTSSATSTTVTTGGGAVSTTTTLIEGYDIKTRFFDQINLKYYFTDNWDGYVGHRFLGGENALALGTEFVVPLDNQLATTAFAEARVGSGEFQGIWGGVKYYFGHKGKTLIQRHRENDDPVNWTSLYSIKNSHFTNSTSSSSVYCDTYINESGSCELLP